MAIPPEQIELERMKIAIEEKRLATELTRAQIQKNPEWSKDVEYSYQAHETGRMFLTILEYIREERDSFGDEE